VFSKTFGRMSTHNFIQINTITPKMVQLTLRYERPTTLIFVKT
jgi:hypothetical protein